MTHSHAGFGRRLAALIYDTLLVLALEILAAGVVIATLQALQAAGGFTLAPYADVSDLLSHHPLFGPLFHLYLLAVWVGFLIYFWTHGGQTLGMRAWGIQLLALDDRQVTKRQALLRLSTSLLGLGNLMVLVDHKQRSWQDYFAKTQVVRVSRRAGK